jgi:hypothetical protein
MGLVSSRVAPWPRRRDYGRSASAINCATNSAASPVRPARIRRSIRGSGPGRSHCNANGNGGEASGFLVAVNFIIGRPIFRFASGSALRFCAEPDIRVKTRTKNRLAAVSPKPNRTFGSGSALGLFDLDVASDGIEHGHLSLLDRCDGIVDGQRSVFVQQLGIIRCAFNAQIVLPLGYFRL